jgi:tetratricopeptide (TPR) repeat protein
VLGALAEALERCGEPAAGLAALEQAVALCEAAREPFAGVLLGRLGRRRALRGEHAEARRLLEEGFRRLQGTGYRPELGALLVQQAAIERLCGDLPAARAALEHVTQMYRQLGVSDRSWPGRALREERDALLRAGDPVRRPADLEVQEVRPAVLVRGPAQV